MRLLRRKRSPRSAPLDLSGGRASTTRLMITCLLGVVVGAVLLSPLGASAASAVSKVLITDPNNTAQQAHVDASGNLQVGGTVIVGNTPNVNVANFPSTTNVGIDPSANKVRVDSTSPLGVTSVDDTGRSAFQITKSLSMPDGVDHDSESVTVPAGKRLVVKFVSAIAGVQPGQQPYNVGVITTADGALGEYFFPMNLDASLPQGDHYSSGQETVIYADPTTVLVVASRSSDVGPASIIVALSGYFIDCSVAPCN